MATSDVCLYQPPQRMSLYFQRALLPDGWAERVRVVCERGVIAAVSCDVAPEPDDERAEVGLPGLPNLHSHAFQRGMAGLSEHAGAQPDSFWTWRELMYRFVQRITPDALEALAAQAYVEMLEAGFTRVGEFHYLHHAQDGAPYADPAELSARIVAAAAHTGIGLTLLPVFYAHSDFAGAPPSAAQRRFVSDPASYARLLESCRAHVARLPYGRVGVAPHSLRAVTPEELAEVIGLAGAGPVHIHVAEQLREVEACVHWSGQRPVEWLLDHAPLDERFCLVHATHMDAREILRLSASGAVAGLCPITEANLGDGTFAAVDYRHEDGAWGIGTDSNVSISARGELCMLEYGQRLLHRARNVLAGPGQSLGRVLFDAAVSGGTQALGVRVEAAETVARPVGLSVGAPGDMVSLAVDAPCFAGRTGDRLLDSWIFAAAHGGIDGVWCAGRKLVSGGVHRERAQVLARYRRALAVLLEA
jgi:formimidoylglutamate deiminase